MCGITGIIDLKDRPVSLVNLKIMTSSLAHRGPNNEGIYLDRNFGLGHRRLSIIDLSVAGNQPMMDPNGRFILSYNGEIYNFEQIKKELESQGILFRSKTDSEVVLMALVTWGPSAITKFNGMFALALWDKQKKELLLARDRYGIKPLYYFQNDKVFIFGSEIKSILANPNYKTEIDHEALLEYMTFQNFFTNKTLFKNVFTFPAGHFAKMSCKMNRPQFTSYWDFQFTPSHPEKTESEYTEELDFLLNQAVSRQLVSDVEIGSYLSGGMDSGSITALAATALPYMKTFTVGFDLKSASGIELTFDEREKAEYMSYMFKTEHYETVLKSGDMERVFPKLVHFQEEPRVGQSYPNFYAAKLASNFCKVTLSGIGGDEIFGGYPWRYYRSIGSTNFEDFIDRYYAFWHRVVPNKDIKNLFSPIWGDVKNVWTRDIFRDVFKVRPQKLNSPEEYISHSMYLEAKTFLHGLLIIEDKFSMAHGMETRVPFLDNDLVDFALKLPLKYKLNNLQSVQKINENEIGDKKKNYFSQTKDGKKILRSVMEKYVPSEVTNSNKQGFSGPDASWFKGDSISYVKSIVYNKKSKIYDYFDPQSVQMLVGQHLDGLDNKRLFIWSLLTFENWLNHFLS